MRSSILGRGRSGLEKTRHDGAAGRRGRSAAETDPAQSRVAGRALSQISGASAGRPRPVHLDRLDPAVGSWRGRPRAARAAGSVRADRGRPRGRPHHGRRHRTLFRHVDRQASGARREVPAGRLLSIPAAAGVVADRSHGSTVGVLRRRRRAGPRRVRGRRRRSAYRRHARRSAAPRRAGHGRSARARVSRGRSHRRRCNAADGRARGAGVRTQSAARSSGCSVPMSGSARNG